MTLTLDSATEQRIQREIDRGIYRDPADVINHALNLLDSQEDWLLANKEAICEHLDESWAQVQRGEVYTPEQARRLLAQHRADLASR